MNPETRGRKIGMPECGACAIPKDHADVRIESKQVDAFSKALECPQEITRWVSVVSHFPSTSRGEQTHHAKGCLFGKFVLAHGGIVMSWCPLVFGKAKTCCKQCVGDEITASNGFLVW